MRCVALIVSDPYSVCERSPGSDILIPETHIRSWTQLQEEVFRDTWDASLSRYRPRCAYRGLSDAEYRLTTGLLRLGGRTDIVERALLRHFRKYAHKTAVERDAFWYWLSLAQHHGLPTRLLDWTYSPQVAMHFATSALDKYHLDGAIWMVNYDEAHRKLPKRLRRILDLEPAFLFTADMLDQACHSIDELQRLTALRKRFMLFFEPPSLDERIVNQYALFAFVSDPRLCHDEWLSENVGLQPNLCRKLIIPHSLKWEIRDKLDQSNITERVLFPGLDGLGAWLKRQYTPVTQGTNDQASHSQAFSKPQRRGAE